MRPDHSVLIQQRQFALDFQHALDDEHHVRAAGVVLVEHQSAGVLQSPWQDALTEFGDLLAVLSGRSRPLPIRSMRLMWLSRLTRIHGQFRREATCSIWVDFPVP